MKFRLICSKENEVLLTELLKANNIFIDDGSLNVLCEENISFDENFNVLIVFKKAKISELLDMLKGGKNKYSSVLVGKADGSYVPIDMKDIVYFNAYGNDTYVNTAGKEQYKVKYKLYELEGEVLPKNFIRINKSEIVNIKYIEQVIPMFKGNLLIKLEGYKETLDISRSYAQLFKERIGL